MASIFSPQGSAVSGRKRFNPVGITRRPPYYPEQPEIEPEIPQAVIHKPVVVPPSPRFPDASSDPTSGMVEGQTNVGGFSPIANANQAGLDAQAGNIPGAVGHGLLALGQSTIGLPATVLGTIANTGYNAVKGALGLGAPANSGSAVASGTGISGLSGPMGLEGELAGLNMGGVGGDDGVGGLGGGPGGTPGGLSGGVGTW